MAHPDPYASYLAQAKAFFEAGEVLKAGQIWQAILKKDPAHAEAKAGLYQVRIWLEAQQAPPVAPAAQPPATPEPPFIPEPTPADLERALPQLHSMNLESHVPEAVPKTIRQTQRSVGGAPPAPTAPVESWTDPEDAPQPAPAPPAPISEPTPSENEALDDLVRQGCTLFDMGETDAAMKKWETVLERSPGHPMAVGYLNEARRDRGLAPLATAPGPAPAWGADAPPFDGDADQLMREAIQLEEMGLPEEALAKLRRVVEVDPNHAEAKGYLAMYERTHAASSIAPPPPPSAPAPVPVPAPPEDHPDFTPSSLPPIPRDPVPEPPPPPPPAPTRRLDPAALEQKLQQAERLLNIRHYEEALFAFQMLLAQDPGNLRATEGKARAQAGIDHSARPAPPPPVMRASPEVEPPASVTAPAAPLRGGPEVTALIKDRAWWKRNPLILGAVTGATLGTLLALWQVRQRDARLQQAVRSAREEALTPRPQGDTIVDLLETATAIRTEGESILQEDPVRAYHRALHLLRLNPSDAAGAQLLERAKAAMLTPPAANTADLQKQIGAGDLDAAALTANHLLMANPEDPVLIGRNLRLNAALAQAHAGRENWGEAREALRRCRALAPQDPAWQARLRLLDSLQTMPKGERLAWVAMLG